MASLYLDHDVHRALAGLLRAAGHTVTRTRELALDSDPDYLQLLTAHRRGAILITRNEGDFIQLHGAWRAWSTAWGVSAAHPGIIVYPHRYGGVVWDPDYAAPRLELLLQPGLPRPNELYRWSGDGWELKT